jgi:hypothetical protein
VVPRSARVEGRDARATGIVFRISSAVQSQRPWSFIRAPRCPRRTRRGR